jgi:hypothetical protein
MDKLDLFSALLNKGAEADEWADLHYEQTKGTREALWGYHRGLAFAYKDAAKMACEWAEELLAEATRRKAGL